VNRKLFIFIHLYLSAFFTAVVALMAVSGGFYLLDIKGDVQEQVIATVGGGAVLMDDPSVENVAAALERAGVEGYEFDYVRGLGKRMMTRPTSHTHYNLEIEGDDISITRRDPDLVASIIELHKGHGPSLFRDFQKFVAAGLLFMVLTGAWLGLQAPRLRRPTGIAVGAGLLLTTVLAIV